MRPTAAISAIRLAQHVQMHVVLHASISIHVASLKALCAACRQITFDTCFLQSTTVSVHQRYIGLLLVDMLGSTVFRRLDPVLSMLDVRLLSARSTQLLLLLRLRPPASTALSSSAAAAGRDAG